MVSKRSLPAVLAVLLSIVLGGLSALPDEDPEEREQELKGMALSPLTEKLERYDFLDREIMVAYRVKDDPRAVVYRDEEGRLHSVERRNLEDYVQPRLRKKLGRRPSRDELKEAMERFRENDRKIRAGLEAEVNEWISELGDLTDVLVAVLPLERLGRYSSRYVALDPSGLWKYTGKGGRSVRVLIRKTERGRSYEGLLLERPATMPNSTPGELLFWGLHSREKSPDHVLVGYLRYGRSRRGKDRKSEARFVFKGDTMDLYYTREPAAGVQGEPEPRSLPGWKRIDESVEFRYRGGPEFESLGKWQKQSAGLQRNGSISHEPIEIEMKIDWETCRAKIDGFVFTYETSWSTGSGSGAATRRCVTVQKVTVSTLLRERGSRTGPFTFAGTATTERSWTVTVGTAVESDSHPPVSKDVTARPLADGSFVVSFGGFHGPKFLLERR